MLKALLHRGFEADLVVGSSVGAINAAYFAGNPTLEGLARLEAIWRGLRRTDVFPVPTLRGLVGLFSQRGYLVEPTGLALLLERHFSNNRLDDSQLPCHIVATDLLAGIELRISTGPLIKALLASAAIPGVFPAVRLDDRYVVDGGVANHTPISAAIELGATRMIVLPTGYSCTLEAPPTRAIGAALHGLNILIARQLCNDVHRFRTLAEILVVPPLCPLGVSPYEFNAAGRLIDRAEQLTEEWIKNGVEMVDGVPHQLPPHSHRKVADPYGPQAV